MAHQIEIKEGVPSIAYVGEPPWHKLGFQYPRGKKLTPKEMMVLSSTDWGVQLRPTFAEIQVDGKTKRVPTGMRALVRDDGSVLTTTGKNWHPIQNETAFGSFADFVEKGELAMEVGGSLRGGRLVFALAKASNGFSLFKGRDEVESYVLFYNPHEYGKSAGVMATMTRVVCQNTLNEALDSDGSDFHARITHRKPFNPDEVIAKLREHSDAVKAYREKAEFLAGRQLDKDAFKTYAAKVFPTKSSDTKVSRLADVAVAALDQQPGAELGAGTWWQGFNAVTFTFDHLAGKQYTREDTDEPMRDRRLFSSWFGWGARRKLFALDLAVKTAEKARAVRA